MDGEWRGAPCRRGAGQTDQPDQTHCGPRQQTQQPWHHLQENLEKKRPLHNVTQRVTRKYARNSGKDWKNQVRNFIPLIDSVTLSNDSTFWVTLTLCKQCSRKMENTRKLIEVLLIRRYSRTIMFCHFASAHTNST